jgi:hypothetical protein
LGARFGKRIVTEILDRLRSTRSAHRRSAARAIGREGLKELAEALHEAYLSERKDPRTWETQYEMVLALGLVGHAPALPDIEPIVRANAPQDMITYGAAQTYVRLRRASLEDAGPSLELLEWGGGSVVDGCLNPLGYDRMMPDAPSIRALIRGAWDLHLHPDRAGIVGLCDPRSGLAAACAGWDPELTRGFLEHCIATGDEPLRRVAEAALEGRYARLG